MVEIYIFIYFFYNFKRTILLNFYGLKNLLKVKV